MEGHYSEYRGGRSSEVALLLESIWLQFELEQVAVILQGCMQLVATRVRIHSRGRVFGLSVSSFVSLFITSWPVCTFRTLPTLNNR